MKYKVTVKKLKQLKLFKTTEMRGTLKHTLVPVLATHGYYNY
jgi:hypothetical protein